MKILLEEAQRRFEAEDTWWRENRDVKALFIEEFSAVLGQISSMPEVGQRCRRTRGKVIQRVLMKKHLPALKACVIDITLKIYRRPSCGARRPPSTPCAGRATRVSRPQRALPPIRQPT